MHRAPRLGLLQAPLVLHRAQTLFARAQQFVVSLSGGLSMRGLAAWAGDCGNYYGHNAIVRVRAFLECCALPTLAGKPPLGGDILSHDFVEAALLCRGGWQVQLAPDLEGSWEEFPATLPEYVARDRRWCQGNLQHLRVAFTAGLRPMSRVHMLLGVAAYLASPVWLGFLVLGIFLANVQETARMPLWIAVSVTLATIALLVGPRLLGSLVVLMNPAVRVRYGGFFNVIWSTVFELLLATLLAPVMMVHHTRIVASILLGRTTRWGAQARGKSTPWRRQMRVETLAMLGGWALATSLSLYAPALLLPLCPIWLPLSVAGPLAVLASSRSAGSCARRLGLFQVPSETRPDPLERRARELQTLTAMDDPSRFRDLVLDPLLVHSQLAKLERASARAFGDRPERIDPQRLGRLRERALRGGPAALSHEEWQFIVNDPYSLRWLHREAWRHWPVETWNLAREQPQLPLEAPRSEW